MEDKKDLLALDVRGFAAAVAAKTPTPGGGSVAGVVAALGTALGEMALNFTRGKKKFAAFEADYARIGHRLELARRMSQDLVADDVSAYRLYRDAAAMTDGPDKDQAMQLALAAAIAVPREMTKVILAMMEDLAALSDKCNPYIISDLVAGAALGAAAVKLCDFNVRINCPQVKDAAAAADLRAASALDVRKAQAILAAVEQAAKPQLG
ncbi:MAG: cyclodeaminase/cyclohydrolase family protein [Phycisphaerae bacterium]